MTTKSSLQGNVWIQRLYWVCIAGLWFWSGALLVPVAGILAWSGYMHGRRSLTSGQVGVLIAFLLLAALSTGNQFGAWLGGGVLGLSGAFSVGLLVCAASYVRIPWHRTVEASVPWTWLLVIVGLVDVKLSPLVSGGLLLFERPSIVATCFGMALVLHLYGAWHFTQKGQQRAYWHLGTAIFAFFGLALLNMPPVWLATGLTLCAIIVYMLSTYKEKMRFGLWLPIGGLMYFAAFFLFLVHLPFGGSSVEVVPMYTDAWEVARSVWVEDVPLLGAGIGQYDIAYQRFGTVSAELGYPVRYIQSPSALLSALTLLGPLFLILVAGVVWLVVRSVRVHVNDSEYAPFVIAWLALLTYLLLLPGHALFALAWIAVTGVLVQVDRRAEIRRGVALASGGACFVALVLVHVLSGVPWLGIYTPERIDREWKQIGQELADTGVSEEASLLAERAFRLARKRVRMQPRDVHVWVERAQLYRGFVGVLPGAEIFASDAIEEARRLAPRHPFVLHEAGVLLLHVSRTLPEDAEQVRLRAQFFAEQLLLLAPNWYPTYILGTDVAIASDQMATARIYLASAYALRPDDRLLARLVRWSMELGQIQDARMFMERLLERHPFDQELRDYYQQVVLP